MIKTITTDDQGVHVQIDRKDADGRTVRELEDYTFEEVKLLADAAYEYLAAIFPPNLGDFKTSFRIDEPKTDPAELKPIEIGLVRYDDGRIDEMANAGAATPAEVAPLFVDPALGVPGSGDDMPKPALAEATRAALSKATGSPVVYPRGEDSGS